MATQEKRRIEKLYQQIKHMSLAERKEVDEILNNMESTEKEILKTYKHSAITPNQHAYEMASIGDEMIEGYEHLVIQRDGEFSARTKMYRRSGSMETKKAADKRANEIYRLNRSLIDKIKPLGPQSVNGAASMIIKDWDRRGFQGFKPSERTIRSLILRGSPHIEHKVGKGSFPKK